MKAIIFDRLFEASYELYKFAVSCGYDFFDNQNYDIMFDPRIVEFCEKRLSPLWGEMVYKGKENHRFRIGFAGAGYIRDINVNKHWIIKYNHVDAPIITYVDVNTNKYGYTRLVEKW